MADFQLRFTEALRRRLFPNAPLHLKEIAGAIGRSENTVTRWWRGETRISGADLDEIGLFFRRRGDPAFLGEVFGRAAAPPAPTGERALDLIRTALAEARLAGPAALDRQVWITADGAMAAASAGHAEHLRHTLGLPGEAGDLVGYATRVLGWIALTERPDGVVLLRHDGRRLAPLAAERACEWLGNHADAIPEVRRAVRTGGRWIEACHPDAGTAAAALARVAFLSRAPHRPWVVKPLPLGAVSDARLGALLGAWRAAPDRIVHAAAASGAFTTSHLFGVSGEDVTSHHVATELGFEARTIEGRNVLSRADTDYAVMLQSRVLRAKREGASYHELAGTIDGNHVRYLNLALPEPGPQGRVLTSTVLLDFVPVAA